MELSQRAARLTDKRAEEADTSRIAAKSRGSERGVPYLGGLAALLQAKAALVGNQDICIPAADVQRLILKDIAAALSLLL